MTAAVLPRTAHAGLFGVEVVEHADPACPYAEVGEPTDETGTADEPGARAAVAGPFPCPWCVRGVHHRSLLADDPITRTERVNADAVERPRPPRDEDDDRAPMTPDERIAEATAFVVGLGRKVEVADVTRRLRRAAETWLMRYEGDFAFLVDLRTRGGRLSAAQAKGVLNCLRAEALRAPAPTPRQAARTPENGTSTGSGPVSTGDPLVDLLAGGSR